MSRTLQQSLNHLQTRGVLGGVQTGPSQTTVNNIIKIIINAIMWNQYTGGDGQRKLDVLSSTIKNTTRIIHHVMCLLSFSHGDISVNVSNVWAHNTNDKITLYLYMSSVGYAIDFL